MNAERMAPALAANDRRPSRFEGSDVAVGCALLMVGASGWVFADISHPMHSRHRAASRPSTEASVMACELQALL